MKRICLVVLLTGCASSTGVVPIGPDTYMVGGKALGLGASGHDATADLYREAGAYCASQSKQLMPVNVQSADGGVGRFPSAKLEFRCLERGDPQLGRPTMQQRPDTVIEDRRR